MKAIIKLYDGTPESALERFDEGLQQFTKQDYAELIALLSNRLLAKCKEEK